MQVETRISDWERDKIILELRNQEWLENKRMVSWNSYFRKSFLAVNTWRFNWRIWKLSIPHPRFFFLLSLEVRVVWFLQNPRIYCSVWQSATPQWIMYQMNGKEVPGSKELHKNNIQYLASHWIWGLEEENESKLTWKPKPKRPVQRRLGIG